MSESKPKGTLNTLLNYRFLKKGNSKLSNSNGVSKESGNSSDSQSTIPPLNSQNSMNGDSDSQQSNNSFYDSQSTISPSQTNGQNPASSPSACTKLTNNNSQSPVFKGSSSSPVFKSTVNHNSISGQIYKPANITTLPLIENSPAKTAWMSKETGGSVHLVNKQNANFKRIKRPQPDSDSDDDFGKESGIKVDKNKLNRLAELFPQGDIKRMKAALVAYEKDFQKAIEFMKSSERMNTSDKKRHNSSGNESDELPAITGSRKRIKMMPDTPSPTKELSQNPIAFLKECFPSKSQEHIQKILKENDGDTERASMVLSSEDSQDAKMSESLTSGAAGTKASKLAKVVKAQKAKANGKGKDDYLSEDEEEDYDENEDDSEDSDEEFEQKTRKEVDNILQFFEEATVEELSAMPGCSKKKSELIVTLRPFKTWDLLCTKFNGERTLSTALISGCKEIMRVRNIIRRLMVRCESISQQMEKVVSTLTDAGDDLPENGNIVKQPELLEKSLSLKPYQLIGLSWLRIMHEQELNGILADEMGLGKTVQAIAFLTSLLEQGEEGPHVIIVPASTIENWLREIQLWCPTLKVIVYFGSQDERRAVRHSIFVEDEEFNVLLTTYNMATGGVEDRVLFKKFNFHYAIFDEGHMLKNMSSLRFQNLMKIAAERRLLLTGTPLQNNLLELMSLLCFVMPEIFQGKTDPLKKIFSMISRNEDKQKSKYEWEKIAQAKRIMKPFVLRRLKKDVLKQLPPKIEKIIKCHMTESQKVVYHEIMARYAKEMENKEHGSSSIAGSGIAYFMQLRKAANHPLLLRSLYTDKMLSEMATKISKEPSHRDRGALPNLIQEDMSVMNDFELLGLCRQYKKYLGKFELDQSTICKSGKFEKLEELLPVMKERGDRILLFSQFTMMLDIMELYLEQSQHKFIRLDGSTPVTDRLQLIDRYNNEPDIFVFLLSTRAGGLGINLTAANVIILHDIDFNPYNDKQAEDRCHRLGQKREVTVIRLIGENTVDESMLRCANEKLALEKDVTGQSNEENNEENSKDVANLLQEVLKQYQKNSNKDTFSVSQNSHEASGSKQDSGMIEIGDEESSSGSEVNSGKVEDNGMIEIGDEDEDDDDVS